MNKIKRFLLYIIGMIILALGLSLSTKLSLGVSALTAFPFMISNIYNLNFGDVTLVYYVVLIIIQVIIHLCRRQYKNILSDVSQLILSVIFTRVLNIFGVIIPEFDNLIVRIILYIVSTLFVGIGASLTIDTKGIPNPCDGIVATISEALNKNLGNTKNVLDFLSVILTCIVSYVLASKIVGIGIGTILSMLFVGRVIFYFNKLFLERIKKIM